MIDPSLQRSYIWQAHAGGCSASHGPCGACLLDMRASSLALRRLGPALCRPRPCQQQPVYRRRRHLSRRAAAAATGEPPAAAGGR